MDNNTKKILIFAKNKKIRDSLKSILSFRYNLVLTEDPQIAIKCVTNDTGIRLIIISEETAEGYEQLVKQFKDNTKSNILGVRRINPTDITNDKNHKQMPAELFFPFKKETMLKSINDLLSQTI